MWTRVLQAHDAESCIFGVPTLRNGEELPVRVFTKGNRLSFAELRVPFIRQGAVRPISLVLDTIPILTDEAAKEFQEQLGDDLQLVPCAAGNGQELWLANVLPVLDCLDRSRSKAEYYPANYPLEHLANGVRFAFELILDPRRVGRHKMFRVKGDCLKLIAAMKFLDAVTRRGLCGLTRGDMPRYKSA